MRLSTAELDWKDNHTPVSKQFGDVYFSAEDGLAESRYVFLQQNNLPADWSASDLFCIGETGFGTGLSFLASWDLWRKTRRPGGRLHYVSVEAFPLTREDLGKALAPWRELKDLSDILIDLYPEPHPGFHRVHMSDDVTLTLLVGDAAEMLGELEAQIDAWFLDGFSPACNPDMWSDEVFAEVARLSRPDARLATFTVAGAVRRGLAHVGFDVEKADGFGRKREMCIGRYTGGPAETQLPAWYRQPAAHTGERKAAIIGGGLAGASCAHALAQRAWDVTLIERQDGVAQEGSGNPSGIVTPRLSADETADSLFYAEAYRYALQEFKALAGSGVGYNGCGVLRLPRDAQEQRRFDTMMRRSTLPQSSLRLVTSAEASEIAGIKINSEALYLPLSGELRPASLCHALVQGASTAFGVEIDKIERRHDQWALLDAQGAAFHQSPICILANGIGATQLNASAWLPLQAFRGQISFVPSSAQSRSLKTIISQASYILPADDGVHAIGATYDKMSTRQISSRQSVKRSDHEKNIQAIDAMLPGLLTQIDLDRVLGRAALRCSTPDHHPVIGPVTDEGFFRETYADLRHGPQFGLPPANYHPGLFAHVALGSRGLSTALLGAELMASQLCGEPWPVARSVALPLHPSRFLVRQIQRSR